MNGTLDPIWRRRGVGPKPDDFGDCFYLREIDLQCEFARRSFGQMQEVFASDRRSPSLLALAHTLLIFAGNVAKLLSASDSAPPKSKKRAARLCKLLGLKDAPLRDVRQARNYLEHFDERMDRFIGSTKGLLIHRIVLEDAPLVMSLDDGREFSPTYLQLLTTKNMQLNFYGQVFSLCDPCSA